MLSRPSTTERERPIDRSPESVKATQLFNEALDLLLEQQGKNQGVSVIFDHSALRAKKETNGEIDLEVTKEFADKKVPASFSMRIAVTKEELEQCVPEAVTINSAYGGTPRAIILQKSEQSWSIGIITNFSQHRGGPDIGQLMARVIMHGTRPEGRTNHQLKTEELRALLPVISTRLEKMKVANDPELTQIKEATRAASSDVNTA